MFQPLALRPGVVKDVTSYAAEGGYADSNLIRFWQGSVESMGGWEDVSLLNPTLLGVPRSATTWKNHAGQPIIAIGTNSKLYVYVDGRVYDVTPIRLTLNPAPSNPIVTLINSSTITITATAHSANVGDYVTISNALPIAGLDVNGNWEITAVVGLNTIEIQHTGQAASTEVGGGVSVKLEFEIGVGGNSNASSGGWGTGTWGTGTWGTPRTITTSGVLALRTWTLQNWGEDLLAMPRGGDLYVWDASTPTARAAKVTFAPNGDFFQISPSDGHVIVFGADSNQRLMKWCDTMDYTTWTGGTSGSIYLTAGVSFAGAAKVGNEILVWDNSGTLYRLRYIGDELVFSFLPFATNVQLLTPASVVVYSDKAYWLGNRMVYMYDGNISAIQCPVIDYMHRRLNTEQKEKIIGGSITKYGELIWFYPSGPENDNYIKFSTLLNVWDIGELARTAWTDGGAFAHPIGAAANGRLYFHERGTSAAGEVMTSYLTTAYTDLDEGGQVAFLRRVMGDVGGEVDFTIYTRRTAQGEAVARGPYRISGSAQPDFAWVRARGRQMAFKFSGAGFWRLGKCQLDYSVEGAQ